MKTMYKAYTALLGYDWTSPRSTVELTNGYVATLEEAKAAVTAAITNPDSNYRPGGWNTGDWWITATTMDEATFTIETNTILYGSEK